MLFGLEDAVGLTCQGGCRMRVPGDLIEPPHTVRLVGDTGELARPRPHGMVPALVEGGREVGQQLSASHITLGRMAMWPSRI